MTVTPTTASPSRPSLEQAPDKPDVLVRLRHEREMIAGGVIMPADVRAANLADAIDTIAGLRASNETHLTLINEAKGQRDEARARVAELERLLRVLVEGASVNLDDLRDNDPEFVEAHYAAADMLGIDMKSLLDGAPAALPAPQPAEASGNG